MPAKACCTTPDDAAEWAARIARIAARVTEEHVDRGRTLVGVTFPHRNGYSIVANENIAVHTTDAAFGELATATSTPDASMAARRRPSSAPTTR